MWSTEQLNEAFNQIYLFMKHTNDTLDGILNRLEDDGK